jgi:hypothetical protein
MNGGTSGHFSDEHGQVSGRKDGASGNSLMLPSMAARSI